MLVIHQLALAAQCVSQAPAGLREKDSQVAQCAKWCSAKNADSQCGWCKCQACLHCNTGQAQPGQQKWAPMQAVLDGNGGPASPAHLAARCCSGTYVTSTPRYKGLNNQMNQAILLITLGALSNATVILPPIHSNFVPGKQDTKPPECDVRGNPAEPTSYAGPSRASGTPCSALISFDLVYDVGQLRAALWEDVCLLSHTEHTTLCGAHQAKLSARAHPEPFCAASGDQYLSTTLFHSSMARAQMHQSINAHVGGTLRLCTGGDCPSNRPMRCNVRPAELSTTSWLWYRALRSHFAANLRPGRLLRPAFAMVAPAMMRYGALHGADYDALHLRTEADMGAWVGRQGETLPTAEHIGKWLAASAMVDEAKNSVRPLYVAHAGATLPLEDAAALEVAVGGNRTRLISKANVYPSSVLQSLAGHRELLALLEQLVLMDADGTFIGYTRSSLSAYTIEGRHERGFRSLDYSRDLVDCCATGLTDADIVMINAFTVKPAMHLTIAIWANYIGDGAYGGSSIFLAALSRAFERRMHTVVRVDTNVSAAQLATAAHAKLHILNQNSFNRNAFKNMAFKPAARAARTVVMRSDGPFVLHRSSVAQDRELFSFTASHADVLVYQSDWSRHETEQRGLDRILPATVRRVMIGNAAEPAYFYPPRSPTGAAMPSASRVVRIVTSVYSTGTRKNIALALAVAERLDRKRFQWLFIGRWPADVLNRSHAQRVGIVVGVVPQRELAVLLRERADLFFAPSWAECFSNSEVQALASGLPVVALNDSSHPEVVGAGGVLFSAGSNDRASAAAAAHAIQHAAARLEDLRARIPRRSIDDIAERYVKLATAAASPGE